MDIISNTPIEIKTSAGILRAYACTDPDQPGISVMLQPDGYNEEIDLSFVSVYENPQFATPLHKERPCDVVVMSYGDATREGYTTKEIVRREDVVKSLGLNIGVKDVELTDISIGELSEDELYFSVSSELTAMILAAKNEVPRDQDGKTNYSYASGCITVSFNRGDDISLNEMILFAPTYEDEDDGFSDGDIIALDDEDFTPECLEFFTETYKKELARGNSKEAKVKRMEFTYQCSPAMGLLVVNKIATIDKIIDMCDDLNALETLKVFDFGAKGDLLLEIQKDSEYNRETDPEYSNMVTIVTSRKNEDGVVKPVDDTTDTYVTDGSLRKELERIWEYRNFGLL